MNKQKRYRLFHSQYGFKCAIMTSELQFLFGVPENITTTDAINDFIKSTGYYVTDL